MTPVLSTLILSWNRAALLKRTIHSYRKATTVDHELLIVDNGSTDGAREMIEHCRRDGYIDDEILLEQNMGGEAINIGLKRLKGQYIHISENDIAYDAAWDTVLLDKFDTFPGLGQLSPFAPFPRAGCREVRPVYQFTSAWNGSNRICLATAGITTTCMFPRSVIDAGVRWQTIDSGRWRWPDDGAFSRSIRALGLLIAWNDVHVATNIGFHGGRVESRH
jgi:glycosyltransferase involved in cell wall biosynthesis